MKRSYIRRKSFKLHTYKSARKMAWNAFSRYIRLRDCLKTLKTTTNGVCYTCECIYPIEELQAGHFIAGRTNSVLFDEIGVRAQCKRCNLFKGGEPLLFRKKLVKEIGEDRVQLLENKRYQVKKYSIIELDALTCHYKQETLNLWSLYER